MIKSIGKMFALAFGQQAGSGKVFHPSQTCPECGSKLFAEEGGAVQVRLCPNPDCPKQIRERIEQWCSPAAMDIAGGDAALVAKLVGKGLARDVAELYRLKVAEIAALPGMDALSAQQFFDALTGSQKREAWRLLFGLGIPHVSVAEAKSLCRHFGSVDNIFAAGAERLRQADGVSAETARSIIRWQSDGVNRKLVRRLFKAGLNFKSEFYNPS
ncbi:MAG: ligase [Verrucomicrobiota bacterium]|jgi:DNA ligase (NAD+)